MTSADSDHAIASLASPGAPTDLCENMMYPDATSAKPVDALVELSDVELARRGLSRGVLALRMG